MAQTGAIIAANRAAVLQRLDAAQAGTVSAFPRGDLA